MAAPRFLFDDDFSPGDLFLGGIQGAWYDPSDNATMFQDAAGLTPVTAVEQPVGSILDKRATAYSNAFNGTSSYINTTLGQSINIATDAFCVEAWCNITSVTNFCLFSTAGGVAFYLNEFTGTVYLGDSIINNVTFSSSALPINTWFHIAVTFDGAGYRVFVNGTLVGSSLTLLANSSFNSVSVGARPSLPAFTSGRISNFRVVKGSAVYTSNFTPPTAPLTPVAGTVLLTCGVQWAGNPALTNQGATVSGLNPFTASPVGNHAFQSTAASRPVLRARYNLLTYSEQFDNAAWTLIQILPFGSGSVVNAAIAPDGTTTADLITQNTSGADAHLVQSIIAPVTGGSIITASVYLRKPTSNGARYAFVVINDMTAVNCPVLVDLDTGSVVNFTGYPSYGAPLSSSSVNVGGGWWRVTLSYQLSAGITQARVFIGMAANGNPASSPIFTGDGTSGIFVWGAQLLTATDATATGNAYQRVGASTDYATGGVFRPYLAFDGVDDRLDTASIDFTATDKMTTFLGLSRLGAGNQCILELSTVWVSNNGTFSQQIDVSAASQYYFGSKGTLYGEVYSASSYTSPVTNVLTGQSDIGADVASLRINGASAGTSALDQGTGNYGNYPMFIGRRGISTLPFLGRFYGLIVRGAASTNTEVSDTEQWLAGKTGLTFGSTFPVIALGQLDFSNAVNSGQIITIGL